MAADLKGCTEIASIDLKPNRLTKADHLDATATVNPEDAGNVVEAVRDPTAGGPDDALETTGVVVGDADPQQFVPDPVELYRQGKFPFDELVTYYDFDGIEQAVEDSERGDAIKPVLRMGDPRTGTPETAPGK
jgi:aryl-alcohol dehydrogenase